jgi:DEAD/DEAH box helicase domain-containing protein
MTPTSEQVEKRLVLDLETKRSFDEVGGAHNRAALGVSVVGVYHYVGDRFTAYREGAFDELELELRQADEVIGFNLIGFDWPVLAAELGTWVEELPTIDLMVEAQKALGHRVSLASLAEATLGASKLGSGLDALAYYRSGEWDKLERYCLEDVKLTRDLYEYAKKHGHLLYQRGDRRGVVAMSFAESPYAALFREASRKRGSVRMVYGTKERLVDVHRFDGSYIRGYCHLRRGVLTFRLDRVEEAEAVASSKPLF